MSSGMIKIPDDASGFAVDELSLPEIYRHEMDHVLIPRGLLQDRTQKLAEDISEFYAEVQEITAVCVLKGAMRFFHDLIVALQPVFKKPIVLEYLRMKSYMDTKSTGEVKVIGGADLASLANKNVLIVEDIVDTGRTALKLMQILNDLPVKPASIDMVSLCLKRIPEGNLYQPKFVGFSIPNRFIVGYGFDLNERYREMDHVAVLKASAAAKYLQGSSDH